MFNVFKKNFVILAIVALAVVSFDSSVAIAKKADKPVAAVVNGNKIFKSEVMKTLKELSVKKSDAQKVYPVAVSQMVNDKLLEAEIKKSRLVESNTFKTRMKAMEKQLLRSLYLQTRIEGKVTNDVVKAKYEEIKKANAGKKEAHALQILVKTEIEAKQVIKDLGKKGVKFSTLAKKRSSDATAQSGGDIGFFAEGEVLPEFSKAAFALKVGKYTKTPVKTAMGWHVIYLKELRTRKVPKFREMEQNIRSSLGQQAVDGLIRTLRNNAKLEIFDFNGKPLKMAATKK